jgi:hypothetical protein
MALRLLRPAKRFPAADYYADKLAPEEVDMVSKLARFLLIILLVSPAVPAQTASHEASTAEKKKVREEREKQARVLVDEITKEAQSLKLPENRIRVDISLAGSLWPRDEQRARALFKDAAESLSELTAAVDSGDREYTNLAHLPQQLRQEMLQVAGIHDARLALDFLRASRPTSPEQQSYPQLNLEAQLEMRLAMQIADKDPREALSVAEDSLRLGTNYETINLLYKLQSQDKAVAERFLGDILSRVRTDDFSKSPASLNIAMILLRTWIENNRAASGQEGKRITVNLSLANLDEQTARELSDLVVKAMLNTRATSGAESSPVVTDEGVGFFRPYSGQVVAIQQLKPMLPDIERLSPNQTAALRSQIAEFDKLSQVQQPWAKYQELAQNGSAEQLMEASKTAPSEIADRLVQQAAWKAFNQGDASGAREIVEKIADSRQRSQMALNLDRQSFYRASEQQKLAEARVLLSRIPSIVERAGILCQLAAGAASKGDKPAALQLLGEAQALIGDQAEDYEQLQSQLQIASGYDQLDASKSAAIVERVIDQVNELSRAALVLNGFDLQYFRGGEFIINGGNQLNMVAQESAQRLGMSSRADFDHAKATAERFQRQEMRVMALLQILQAHLMYDDQ